MIVKQGSRFDSSANCETHRAIKIFLILNGFLDQVCYTLGTGRRDRGRLCATKSRGDECVAHPSLGTPRPRIGRDGLSRVYGEFGHEPRPRGRGWSPAAVNEFFFLGGYATPPQMQSRN
jgi:hypothetical protein